MHNSLHEVLRFLRKTQRDHHRNLLMYTKDLTLPVMMAKTTSAKYCLYRQAMYNTVTWCYPIKVSFSLVLSNPKRSKPSTEQKVFFSVDRSVTAGYDHVSYNYLLNFTSFSNALNAATTKTPWSVKKANEVGSTSTVVRVVTKMYGVSDGSFFYRGRNRGAVILNGTVYTLCCVMLDRLCIDTLLIMVYVIRDINHSWRLIAPRELGSAWPDQLPPRLA